MLERLPPPQFSLNLCLKYLASCLVCLSYIGCALGRPSKQPDLLSDSVHNRWEDDPVARKRRPYEKRKLGKKPSTLKELSNGFQSPDECFRRARTNAAQNLEASWALAQACVQHRNFDKLEDFLDRPWTPIIRGQWPKAVSLVTKISALAGGRVELDVGLCNKFGLEITHFRETFRDIEGAMDELVMFRGTVLRSWVVAGKTRVLLRYEGREIFGSTTILPHLFKSSEDYVFVGHLKGVQRSKKWPDESLKISLIHAEPVRIK